LPLASASWVFFAGDWPEYRSLGFYLYFPVSN
jgi:hypothetical protein